MITTVLKPMPVRDRVTCNRCKVEARFSDDDFAAQEFAQEFLHVEFEYGYGSEHFGDGKKIEFDLCEACVFHITKEFAIPVVVKGKREL